ncbi:MAG: hemagglutinin protein [Lewinella sp.]|uniref:hemagglutinin protein n=1 Tax=Lewinella sp. TaxID=2004506 RepID=UPI003D6A24D2
MFPDKLTTTLVFSLTLTLLISSNLPVLGQSSETIRLYDNLNRLIVTEIPPCIKIQWYFDQTGNRLLHEIKGGTSLTAKVYLQGAYNTGNGLLNDNIREATLIPIEEPYASLGLSHLRDGGGEKTDFSVFSTTGNDAVVDWVFVELRDKNDNETVITTRSALIQRDGDIVDYDGVSPVRFINTCPDDFYVVIRHRNHLGVMTNATVALTETPTTVVDFTDPSLQTWGSHAQRDVNGIRMMWSGNGNGDDLVVYQGAGTDISPITVTVFTDPNNVLFDFSFPSPGYELSDYNMDGVTIYQGANTDVTPITLTVFTHPLNITFDFSFPVREQLPENY